VCMAAFMVTVMLTCQLRTADAMPMLSAQAARGGL